MKLMGLKILKNQIWTLLFLLLFLFIFVVVLPMRNFQSGELWGISTINWVIISIILSISHQVYVLVCWRYEIYHSTITKIFGTRGFLLYEIGFFILFFSRIISIFLLAISNANTLPIPVMFRLIIAGIMIIPMLYAFYSILRYFGIHRAAGADHFLPEYRKIPFVRGGIYKYFSNAMYLFALFILWIPGLLFGSITAILIATFNYIYVWVHYYTLERPDFKIIYGTSEK